MANKDLNTTLSLKAVDSINGILSLDASMSQTLVYDDENVVTNSLSAVTSSGGTQVINKSVNKLTYVFIKNTDKANFVTLSNDDDEDWGRLLAGEWAFFPVAPSVGLEVKADTSAVTIDVALFQKT